MFSYLLLKKIKFPKLKTQEDYAVWLKLLRNGEKLSSVNRDRGKLFVQKNPSSPAGFVASFSAGYPLKIGGKFVLKVLRLISTVTARVFRFGMEK